MRPFAPRFISLDHAGSATRASTPVPTTPLASPPLAWRRQRWIAGPRVRRRWRDPCGQISVDRSEGAESWRAAKSPVSPQRPTLKRSGNPSVSVPTAADSSGMYLPGHKITSGAPCPIVMATGIESVITVHRVSGQAGARANWIVVEPELIIRVSPSRTSSAALRPIRSGSAIRACARSDRLG